jgi:hypothetical protein
VTTDAPTLEGPPDERQQTTRRREADDLAMVVVWSATHCDRLGEVLLVPAGADTVVGRGSGGARLVRQRPGVNVLSEPFDDPFLSRRHLVFRRDDEIIHVEDTGKRALVVDGQETVRAALCEGQVAEIAGAIDIARADLGEDTVRAATPLQDVGILQRKRGLYDGAVRDESASLALKAREFGPDSTEVAEVLDDLVYALVPLGRLDEARDDAEKELAIYSAHYPPDHEFMAWPLTAVGYARVARGDFAGAARPLEKALLVRRAHPRDPLDDAETELALARALWGARKDRARARALAEHAEAAYAAVEPARHVDLEEARRVLACLH